MIAPMVSEPCITLLQLYWTTNDLNPELLNEEPESRDPETVSEEIQGAEEAVQRSPNLEQLQETLQSWRSYEEQLNENPVAEFKEFERRFKFKPRFKYGWFHLKLY